MGIQGLLPFLKKIHQPVNIGDFQGCTVAIDAYCWLHKGAFACAEKLALGEKTDQYVYYCMKYINYMLRKGLKPILVFDGCHLKSKADVEKTRKERRELYRKKAAQFLREGKRSEARESLQRCVDITPQMALELMNACRDQGVDCIVAPYEADAQLAYLNLSGIAQIIVTEDSDLLLFGCEKIIFKMDFYGNGTLIEKAHLNEVLTIQGGFYTFEKFRYMCILSGCDYLASLPGIGLNKACKVFKTARQPDLKQLLKKLPTYLKMSLTVTDEYVEGFIRADNTFLYQLVYDPLKRRLCPLNPYPPGTEKDELDYAGEYFPEEKSFQIALGNIDIHNQQAIAFFNPDTFVAKNRVKPKHRHQLSIWDKNYRVKSSSPCKDIQLSQVGRASLHDKEQTVKIKPIKRSPAKLKKSPDMKTAEEIMSIFGDDEKNEAKKARRNILDSFAILEGDEENVGGDFKMDQAVTNTPANVGQEDESFYNDSEDDDVNNKQRGRKRRFSGTPSKCPSAANIGEDVFLAHSEKVKENFPSSLVPGTNRNVFAVSSNTNKPPKFNLDALAVQVKSKYFHLSQSTKQQMSSPSKLKTKLKSPQKITSIKMSNFKKNSISGVQNTIRMMFENAPVQPKHNEEKDPKLEQKDSKAVIPRYLVPITSQLPSAKQTFESLKNKSLENIKNNAFEKQPKSSLSIFSHFQHSRQEGNGNKASQFFSGSAFSWPDKKSDHSTVSLSGKDQTSSSVEKVESEIRQATLSSFPIDNSEQLDSKVTRCKKKHVENEMQKKDLNIKASKLLSSFFTTTYHHGTFRKLDSALSTIELSCAQNNDDIGEVMELKSYEYNDFLKTFNGRSESEIASSEDSPASEEPEGENKSFQDNVEGSKSLELDSSMVKSNGVDSQDISLSGGDDRRSVSEVDSSQQSIVCSIDSHCLSKMQDCIDLTDAEPDSQISLVPSSPMPSLSRPSVCRVPGLSRSKSKNPKKTSETVHGQKSIKDLMSKFQYSRAASKLV